MQKIVLKQNNTPTKIGYYIWADAEHSNPHLAIIIKKDNALYVKIPGYEVPLSLNSLVFWSESLDITDFVD